MAQGWIKLHRSLQEHWLWDEKPFSKGQAWVDLIMLANHTDVKRLENGELKVFEKGTVCRSKAFLAERWGWDRKKVDNFLALLESDKMVSTNCTTHGTTVTIENYAKFNDLGATDGTTNRTTTTPTTPQPLPQPLRTNNNDKNYKNEKNDYSFLLESERHKRLESREVMDKRFENCGVMDKKTGRFTEQKEPETSEPKNTSDILKRALAFIDTLEVKQ